MTRLQEALPFIREFNDSHDKVMIEAGITSQEDRKVLKGGDLIKVHKLLPRKDT
jgi:hypothetical protein